MPTKFFYKVITWLLNMYSYVTHIRHPDTPSSPTLDVSLNVSFCESAFRVSTSCHGPWVSLLKYLVNPISLFASCPIPLSIALIRPLSHYPYPMWKSTILFLGVKRWKSKSISSHHQIFIFYFLFFINA